MGGRGEWQQFTNKNIRLYENLAKLSVLREFWVLNGGVLDWWMGGGCYTFKIVFSFFLFSFLFNFSVLVLLNNLSISFYILCGSIAMKPSNFDLYQDLRGQSRHFEFIKGLLL